MAARDTPPRSAASRGISQLVGVDAGSRYLRAVGPFYGLFGLGMALYFASQGAGRLLWPLLANLTRLVIAAGGGSLMHVFLALSVALAAFGLMNAGAVAGGRVVRAGRVGAGARGISRPRLLDPSAAGVSEP